jgi:hypothetical protein
VVLDDAVVVRDPVLVTDTIVVVYTVLLVVGPTLDAVTEGALVVMTTI